MILSVSRRTDIPSYYSEWFFNRIKEKYVLVRNPMNYHQVSRIDLSPDVMDAIVFWTKNPIPMISKLEQLRDYNYYFQFTLTGYGQDVERNIPPKKEIILPAFQRFVEIADRNGLYIDTCAEAGDFGKPGVKHAHCIDKERIERICGCKLNVDKDPNQRKECGCVASIDIGAYNTCKNGCLYCYANYIAGSVEKNYNSHNPKSPLLLGEITEADVIKERKVKSLKETQLNLLDIM